MSGTSDTNWRSYVGPQDNGLTVNAAEWQAPLDPENWDDLVKCSNCTGLVISGLTIPASREDSIDCVRGYDQGHNQRTDALRLGRKRHD
jgi:hypothetical protein